MTDYPDTPEGREAKLFAALGEDKVKVILENRAKRETEEAEKAEAKRIAAEKEAARLLEILTIPINCTQCRKSVGESTGTRLEVLGQTAYTIHTPAAFGTVCDDCRAINSFNNMVVLLQLPDRYKPMGFDTYKAEGELVPVVEKLKELSQKSSWIVLMGKRGIGKTHLGVSCLKESYQKGLKGRYISAASFYPYFVRSGYKRDDIWEKVIAHHRVLMLDDLGQGEAAKSDGDFDERVRQEIGATVDFFYRHERQLIITTNIESVSEMMERYGSWAVDRILQCGELIKMPDLPSMRPSLRDGGKVV